MTTDTSEKGLETLIMRHMTGTDGLAVTPNMVAERPPPYGGTGYTAGSVCRGERLTRRNLMMDIAADLLFSDHGVPEYTAGRAGSILNSKLSAALIPGAHKGA